MDVELIDPLEQFEIRGKIQPLLGERGYRSARISIWGAGGFSNNLDMEKGTEGSQGRHENKGRILVVDDDPGIFDILKIFLERQAYVVTTASNWNEDASVLRKQPTPNLVLLTS